MKKHLIFDLDGTLIDSAPSILESFAGAFARTGTALQVPLTSDVIGPPLMETLKRLSGSEDAAVLQALAEAFKQRYDSEGYLKSVVFSGVSSLLQQLHEAGYSLYIATNKRFVPTEKIIRHLAWQPWFKGVYALDYFQPALATKADMIGRIVREQGLRTQECLYIGDRVEDGLAAEANQMDFTLVSWGYAEDVARSKPHWFTCAQPSALPALISMLNVCVP